MKMFNSRGFPLAPLITGNTQHGEGTAQPGVTEDAASSESRATKRKRWSLFLRLR